MQIETANDREELLRAAMEELHEPSARDFRALFQAVIQRAFVLAIEDFELSKMDAENDETEDIVRSDVTYLSGVSRETTG